MYIQKIRFGFLIFAIFMTVHAVHAETAAPEAMVRSTASDVLEILKTDKDIENGNMNRLGKLVEDKIATKFDFDRMSRLVLGRSWVNASREQQDQFVTEFRALLIRTYASALSKYRDQTITYKPGHEDQNDTDVKVRTQILQPGGPTIALDYSLEKVADTWKVYDVSIEGLSLVVTYRGQFAEEIRQNGLNGLIQRLSEKNRRSSASLNSSVKSNPFDRHDRVAA